MGKAQNFECENVSLGFCGNHKLQAEERRCKLAPQGNIFAGLEWLKEKRYAQVHSSSNRFFGREAALAYDSHDLFRTD